MKLNESKLQQACVSWFNLAYPQHHMLLFAVPNGGYRNAREAGRMKAEGVVAGVADLILLLPNKKHNALCLEMKVGKNKQTFNQVSFQRKVERTGARYEVVRSFDEFRQIIKDYLLSSNA